MKSKNIKCHFSNSRGNVLDARLDLPADKATDSIQRYIIICHCFTCTKETITTYRISRQLAELGYAVLRFDFTGLGNSKGEFSASTFTTTQDDLRAAIEFLTSHYRAPDFLIGHSLGGTTAISIAQEYDSIRGVVTIASPSEPDHVLHHFGDAMTYLERGLPASIEVAGQQYEVMPEFIDDVRNVDMPEILSRLTKPVLVINIDNDALVDEINARQLQEWTASKTTRLDISGSDHLLSDRAASIAVGKSIHRWLSDLDA